MEKGDNKMGKLYVFDFIDNDLATPDQWTVDGRVKFSRESYERINNAQSIHIDFEIYRHDEIDSDDVIDQFEGYTYVVFQTEGDDLSFEGFNTRDNAEFAEFEFWKYQAQRIYAESYVFNKNELYSKFKEIRQMSRRDLSEHDDVLLIAIDHLLNQNENFGKRRY